jgi:hypothetical protein
VLIIAVRVILHLARARGCGVAVALDMGIGRVADQPVKAIPQERHNFGRGKFQYPWAVIPGYFRSRAPSGGEMRVAVAIEVLVGLIATGAR